MPFEVDGSAPPLERIVGLMREGWKLSRPNLIISITGGAIRSKTETPKVKYAFQRALIATATTTGRGLWSISHHFFIDLYLF